MKCRAVRPLLSAFLDGELAPQPAAAVAAHLDGCPACQAELADVCRLVALLDAPAARPVLSAPVRPLPPDFTRRVLAALPPDLAAHPAPDLAAGLNLLWPWLRQRWSRTQLASVVYALSTTAAVAAAALLVLQSIDGLEPLSSLNGQAHDAWVTLRVQADVLGAWLSRL